jgi:hypothetical protein
MPILNFKPQFVDAIRSGRKRHTIRATRKVPIKVGDKLYLYCGLRHKGAFRILPDAVNCTKTFGIQIRIVFITSACQLKEEIVVLDGQKLDKFELETLATADGFSDWNQMRWFWIKTHGKAKRAMGSRYSIVNFTGQIIHWRYP